MVEGGTLPETRLAALNEVWKAFSLFFASVPEDFRELSELRSGWPKVEYSFSRCTVAVRAAADSDTGTGSELLVVVVPTAHARDNAPVVVCDISAGRFQGSHRDTPKYDEGYIGDVDKTSSWRDGRCKANTGDKTTDIAEVFLIVDHLNTIFTCVEAGEAGGGSRVLSGYHEDGCVGYVNGPVSFAFSRSLSVSNPLGGITLPSFQAFSPQFLERHAVFLCGSGAGIVCQARWGRLTSGNGGGDLLIWTGLGLNIDIGGSLGNVSAIQIIDIPAGQLKDDVS